MDRPGLNLVEFMTLSVTNVKINILIWSQWEHIGRENCFYYMVKMAAYDIICFNNSFNVCPRFIFLCPFLFVLISHDNSH